MPSLSTVRSANAKYVPPLVPVALFVGGTSGIGRAMAEAFARYTKGNAHIIISGRNQEAADSILASFPEPTIHQGSDSKRPLHEFIYCEASLMKNVHVLTTELLVRLPKINYLVMSSGFLSVFGRDQTEEGLDKKLALNYYARWKLINDLMPLLRNAKDAGEHAKVFSVMGAGFGQEIDVNDLGLNKSYTFLKSLTIPSTYNDLMMEEFALRYPDIAFTHVHPGIVRTPILEPSHWTLRPFSVLLWLVLYPFSVSPEVCAEHMLWAMFDGEKGVFRRVGTGDDIGKWRYFGTEEQRKLLWEHTVDAVKV